MINKLSALLLAAAICLGGCQSAEAPVTAPSSAQSSEVSPSSVQSQSVSQPPATSSEEDTPPNMGSPESTPPTPELFEGLKPVTIPTNPDVRLEDLSITAEDPKLNEMNIRAEFHLKNNGGTPLNLNRIFYLYCKDGEQYRLIDEDGDGMSGELDNPGVQFPFEPNSSGIFSVYLGCILQDGKSSVGSYRLELPIDESRRITCDFEVVKEDVVPDTGITMTAERATYSLATDTSVAVIIANNTNTEIGYGLHMTMSRYEDGEWVQLPFVDGYAVPEIASICMPHSQNKQVFKFANINETLVPGRYRIYKQLDKLYFAEFTLK